MDRSRIKVLLFSLIGVFNTLFDIALYTILRSAGQSVVVANVVSVSAALIGSYILNSRYTFKSRRWTAKKFIGFVAVTVFGLWVLQTAAIYVIAPPLNNIPDSLWNLLGPFEHAARLAVPKLLATSVTLVWNYVWYNKVIFKDEAAPPTLDQAL